MRQPESRLHESQPPVPFDGFLVFPRVPQTRQSQRGLGEVEPTVNIEWIGVHSTAVRLVSPQGQPGLVRNGCRRVSDLVQNIRLNHVIPADVRGQGDGAVDGLHRHF